MQQQQLLQHFVWRVANDTYRVALAACQRQHLLGYENLYINCYVSQLTNEAESNSQLAGTGLDLKTTAYRCAERV